MLALQRRQNWEAFTDSYGDCLDLPVGLYELTIHHKGYEYKVFNNLKTTQAINLGDIALERA